jgi:hypothetical protein
MLAELRADLNRKRTEKDSTVAPLEQVMDPVLKGRLDSVRSLIEKYEEDEATSAYDTVQVK